MKVALKLILGIIVALVAMYAIWNISLWVVNLFSGAPKASATVITSTSPVTPAVMPVPQSSGVVTVLVTHALSTPVDLTDRQVYPKGVGYLLNVLSTNHDLIVVYDGDVNRASRLTATGYTWLVEGGDALNQKPLAYGRTVQFQLTTNSPAGTVLSIRVVPY